MSEYYTHFLRFVFFLLVYFLKIINQEDTVMLELTKTKLRNKTTEAKNQLSLNTTI